MIQAIWVTSLAAALMTASVSARAMIRLIRTKYCTHRCCVAVSFLKVEQLQSEPAAAQEGVEEALY